MFREKSWRRHQEARIIEKRIQELKEWSQGKTEGVEFTHALSKTHFGCGCSECKPWKHKKESKFKASERRELEK